MSILTHCFVTGFVQGMTPFNGETIEKRLYNGNSIMVDFLEVSSLIISASRRTDIPAFFGDWFINRVKEGFFVRVNPMNPKQIKKVSLKPEDVDATVF